MFWRAILSGFESPVTAGPGVKAGGGWKRFHVGQADEVVTLHLLVLGDLQGNWAEGSVCLG